MHQKSYFLKWEEHPSIKPHIGKEEELDWEPIAKVKEMFLAQMNVFVKFQVVICLILALIHISVHFQW